MTEETPPAAELAEPASLPVLDALPGSLGDWALFLDLDGTLIDIAARPEAVVVPPELVATLVALSLRLHGALAIVTGRKLGDVDNLLGPVGFPVAAMHGAVLRMGDQTAAAPGSTEVPAAVTDRLHDFVLAHPGLLLEPKGESLAVHYRNVPELEALVHQRVIAVVAEHAPQHDIQPGKMVFEIKPRGVDKGRAVAALLETKCFAGRRPAVFGDDLTDEAGFRVGRARGGLATIVGAPERKTAATCRLGSPAQLRGWLAALAADGRD